MDPDTDAVGHAKLAFFCVFCAFLRPIPKSAAAKLNSEFRVPNSVPHPTHGLTGPSRAIASPRR